MEVALRQLAGLEVELELLERGVGGLLASQQDLEVLRKVEGLIITELLSQQRVGDEANRQKREHHSEQGTYHVIRSLPDGRPQWHRLRLARVNRSHAVHHRGDGRSDRSDRAAREPSRLRQVLSLRRAAPTTYR